MKNPNLETKSTKSGFLTYVIGYILSLYLTLSAYLLVKNHFSSGWTLALIVIGLALMQFFVQLLFFLHLGRDAKPRWRVAVFLGMIGVVLILVFGSLWIMNNLNYRQMPATPQVNQYLNSQDGL